MTRPTFQRIGVVANLDKEGITVMLAKFVPDLLAAGFDVFVDPQLEQPLADIDGITAGLPRDCDLVIALGGDGTMLKVARQVVDEGIPILGIRAGRLGFLTETLTPEIIPALKNGGFKVQERMRVQASIREKGKDVETFTGLNDVVVHGAGFSRMVMLRTESDGKLMREYAADGVILSTPTGSTAYSLSAGGPLLVPTAEALLLTPLCPHSLSIRPIVLDEHEKISIRVVSRSDIRVTVDGQKGNYVKPGQHVVVQKSDKVTKLLVPNDYDFFALLREKL